MVTGLFGTVLNELSQALKTTKLEPDRNNTCLLRFTNGQEVYLEMDKKDKYLVICTSVGPVPLGRYRESIFRAALAANALKFPRHGNFAFSTQANELVLFEQLPIEDLRGDRVAEFLGPFIQKAASWKESIGRGEVPIVDQPMTSRAPSGLLGLK